MAICVNLARRNGQILPPKAQTKTARMSAPFPFMLRCERTAISRRSMADVVAAVDHAAAAAAEDRRSALEPVREDRIDHAAFARDPHFIEPEARELGAAVRRE